MPCLSSSCPAQNDMKLTDTHTRLSQVYVVAVPGTSCCACEANIGTQICVTRTYTDGSYTINND